MLPAEFKNRGHKWKNGCIVWTGYKGACDYGVIGYKNKQWKTHRLIWTLAHGAIPEKMKILHKCDNPPCINIEHLFMGTQQDNVRDMIKKSRGGWPGTPGSLHHAAKLNEKIVLTMRVLRKKNMSFNEIAKKFGVTTRTAWRAITGRTWKHVRSMNE